jgi:hypothetical protein
VLPSNETNLFASCDIRRRRVLLQCVLLYFSKLIQKV